MASKKFETAKSTKGAVTVVRKDSKYGKMVDTIEKDFSDHGLHSKTTRASSVEGVSQGLKSKAFEMRAENRAKQINAGASYKGK